MSFKKFLKEKKLDYFDESIYTDLTDEQFDTIKKIITVNSIQDKLYNAFTIFHDNHEIPDGPIGVKGIYESGKERILYGYFIYEFEDDIDGDIEYNVGAFIYNLNSEKIINAARYGDDPLTYKEALNYIKQNSRIIA